MQIRSLKQGDLVRCAELFAAVFSASPWNEPWSVESAGSRLRHFFESPGFIGFVAEREQRLAGFLLGNTEPFHTRDVFYLREMCVLSDFQNGGMGTALLRQVEDFLTLEDVAGIYLITERATPAARFYLKNGYGLGEATGFYAKQLGPTA